MGIAFFGGTTDIREALKRAIELTEKGEYVKEEDMIERLVKVAPREWFKNEDFAESRIDIEKRIDEIKNGISICDCSKTMDSVHLITWEILVLWDDIHNSKLSKRDKDILIEDLRNIDTLVKGQLIPEFNLKCGCISKVLVK